MRLHLRTEAKTIEILANISTAFPGFSPSLFPWNLRSALRGVASWFNINQFCQDPGLVLSRPCQAYKSEFLLNQHQELASLESLGPFWNGESHAVRSNAGPEPSWSEWINLDCVLHEVGASQVHQESPIASAGVTVETPSAYEAGASSIEAAFQTTCHPFEFCQPSFGLNVPAKSNIDLQQKALLACSNGTNSKVVRDSISPIQSDWNTTTSSSALTYDCDLRDKTGRGFTMPLSDNFRTESQENLKSRISRLSPSKCPHCRKNISRKQFRYALLM